MDQDIFYLVRLFYPDADTHTVDRGFDEHFFILVSRDEERIEENFGGAGGFYLGDVVSFGGL